MKKVRDLEKYWWIVKTEDALPRLSESTVESLSGFIQALAGEYRSSGTLLGCRRDAMFRAARDSLSECYGRPCALPVGPSACPLVMDLHGIASAYLSGARAFELPVQASIARVLSRPAARRPAGPDEPRPAMRVLRDLSLARVALVVLGRLLSLDPDSGPGEPFVFTANLSAETDAETEDFLSALRDGRALALRAQLLEDFKLVLSGPDPFAGTDLAGRLLRIKDLDKRVRPEAVAALTVAIPDGLPLKDAEPRLRALVSLPSAPLELKLGPWALGIERLSDAFRRSGAERDQRLFGRNAATRYSDAIMAVRRIFTLSRERSSFFGLRIDGSLPAAIGRSILRPDAPDAAVPSFLSGPDGFGPGLCLAAKIAEDMSGTLPLSFSGGLDADRAAALFRAGVRPLGLATALYSQAGFGAIRPIAEAVGASAPREERLGTCVDARALRDYSSAVLR